MNKKFVRSLVLPVLLFGSLSAKASWLTDLFLPSLANTPSGPINVTNELAVLESSAPSLSPKVLKLALTAYDNAYEMGYPLHKSYLTVIDYSKPDSDKRLWVIDLHNNKVLYNTYVAHGQGSGELYAEHFSNSNGTHASSIGVFLTRDTYYGSKGLSLRLSGLDKGFNDQAESREIVMHGAWYVNSKFAEEYGHIGRSWGCPSVPVEMVRPIVNTIKDGSLIFAYAPKFSWLHSSRFLNA